MRPVGRRLLIGLLLPALVAPIIALHSTQHAGAMCCSSQPSVQLEVGFIDPNHAWADNFCFYGWNQWDQVVGHCLGGTVFEQVMYQVPGWWWEIGSQHYPNGAVDIWPVYPNGATPWINVTLNPQCTSAQWISVFYNVPQRSATQTCGRF